MIDDLWLIKLKIDIKSRNPDMLLEEYIKTTKDELLSYTTEFKKGQILYRGRLGYKSYGEETEEGNLSEANAILFYFAQKYKKDLLGQNIFENAKINQWIQFSSIEINRCLKEIIYPIFGWKEFCKESLFNSLQPNIGYIIDF